MSQDLKIISDIKKLITPITELNGFEIVRIKLLSAGNRKTLQIMAELPDGTMNIESCEKLSREYSLMLDVNEMIHEEYTLEVSSPGIDRPLTRKKDFIRWRGFETLVQLKEKKENRLKIKGLLKDVISEENNEDFQFIIADQVSKKDFTIDFLEITSARLTLSDELLNATKKGASLHGFSYDEPEAVNKSVSKLEQPTVKNKKMLKKTVNPKKIDDLEIVS